MVIQYFTSRKPGATRRVKEQYMDDTSKKHKKSKVVQVDGVNWNWDVQIKIPLPILSVHNNYLSSIAHTSNPEQNDYCIQYLTCVSRISLSEILGLTSSSKIGKY